MSALAIVSARGSAERMSALLGRLKHAAAANKKLKYQALRELFIDIQYCREDEPKSGLPNNDLKFVDLFNDIRRQIRIIIYNAPNLLAYRQQQISALFSVLVTV